MSTKNCSRRAGIKGNAHQEIANPTRLAVGPSRPSLGDDVQLTYVLCLSRRTPRSKKAKLTLPGLDATNQRAANVVGCSVGWYVLQFQPDSVAQARCLHEFRALRLHLCRMRHGLSARLSRDIYNRAGLYRVWARRAKSRLDEPLWRAYVELSDRSAKLVFGSSTSPGNIIGQRLLFILQWHRSRLSRGVLVHWCADMWPSELL
jgi:hypothetical protein